MELFPAVQQNYKCVVQKGLQSSLKQNFTTHIKALPNLNAINVSFSGICQTWTVTIQSPPSLKILIFRSRSNSQKKKIFQRATNI